MPRMQKKRGFLHRVTNYFRKNQGTGLSWSVYVHQMGEGNSIQANQPHGFYHFHGCSEEYAAEAAADAYRIEQDVDEEVRLSVLVMGSKRIYQ